MNKPSINRAATIRCHPRVDPKGANEGVGNATDCELPTRARARGAHFLIVVSASFGLAGCGAIDDLKDQRSRRRRLAYLRGQPTS